MAVRLVTDTKIKRALTHGKTAVTVKLGIEKTQIRRGKQKSWPRSFMNFSVSKNLGNKRVREYAKKKKNLYIIL